MNPVVTVVAITTSVALLSAVLSGWLAATRFARHASANRPQRTPREDNRPRIGGLAILVSACIGATTLALLADGDSLGDLLSANPRGLAFSAVSTLSIIAVSLWDDLWEVPPAVRLTVHSIAGVGLVVGSSMHVGVIVLPGNAHLFLGLAAVPCAVLLVVWMTNLFNFMDGMDGLSAQMSVIGFGTLGSLALYHGDGVVSTISGMTAAAAAGFLKWNIHPGRITMGDVGAASLGFLAAALTLRVSRDGTLNILVPLIVFSPFIVDATVTLIRRLLSGEDIFKAHKEHYYQRLLTAGWSPNKVLASEFFLATVCGVIALSYDMAKDSVRWYLLTFIVVLYVALAAGVRGVEIRRQNAVEE